ncbi:hypothetical protein [Streptomyces xanthophaeus]
MNPIYDVIINGRTFSPCTFNRHASASIAVAFRDSSTRDEAIDFTARLYGVDRRRAFQIARHFKNRTDRLRTMSEHTVAPLRANYDMPRNDYGV